MDAWVALNNKTKATSSTNDTVNSKVHEWWSLSRVLTSEMNTWWTNLGIASGDNASDDKVAEASGTGAYGTTWERAATVIDASN